MAKDTTQRMQGHDGAGASEPKLSQLVGEFAEDTRRLIRDEVDLAKRETGRKARRLATDGGWIGAGAAIAAVGGLCLVFALALGLGVWLGSYWLGSLVTGALLLLTGGSVLWKGLRDIRSVEVAPKETVATLKEDADWARKEARKFKRELSRG